MTGFYMKCNTGLKRVKYIFYWSRHLFNCNVVEGFDFFFHTFLKEWYYRQKKIKNTKKKNNEEWEWKETIIENQDRKWKAENYWKWRRNCENQIYAEIQFISIFNVLSVSYRVRLFTKNSENLIRTTDTTTLQCVPRCYLQVKDVDCT